jgi:hypothetical protein
MQSLAMWLESGGWVMANDSVRHDATRFPSIAAATDI